MQVFTDNEVRPGEKRISCMLFDAKHDRLITGTKRIKAVSMAVFEAQRYVDPAVIFVGEGEGGGGQKNFWPKAGLKCLEPPFPRTSHFI